MSLLPILFIILNIFLLESLLSVDNAAVLAMMVKDLPGDQKNKALRYGIIGAYVLRGVCLLFASVLVKVLWLKIIGGVYLLYLTYGHFSPKVNTLEENHPPNWATNLRDKFSKTLGLLWSTIILVELVDLTFSIDNIFAVVAMSNSFILIMLGVAIGILAMRFIAMWFVKLIEKYPSLETSAFIVIGLLGLKLILTGIVDLVPAWIAFRHILESHYTDLSFSAVMMAIFFIPMILPHTVEVENQNSLTAIPTSGADQI